MSKLIDIASVVNCGLGDILGSGNSGCPFDFENMSGGELRFWKPGTITPKETEYDRAYIRSMQQAGKVIILTGIYDFAWNNEENILSTGENSGLKSRLSYGNYEADFMFKKGLYNQKQLDALGIDNYWEVQLVDGAGNELWRKNAAGDYQGLSTALVAPKPITFKTRSADQLTTLQVQFSNPIQMNRDLSWISYEQKDFGVGEIDGANQVALSIPAAPSAAATSFVVKSVLAKDGSTFVNGLAVEDFLVKVNNATVTPTSVTGDATTKSYTFEVAALSVDDSIQVSLYDSTVPSEIVLLGVAPNDKAYKSNTATTVAVA